MLKVIPFRCSDIGSPYCPCLLAETNHCTFCSHLQGKKFCDCNWAGLCIFSEWTWKSKEKTNLPAKRMEFDAEFVIEQRVSDNVYILDIPAPKQFLDGMKGSGMFVFLRQPQDSVYSHFPIGIMSVDDDSLKVVIETIGPKTVRFFRDNNKKVHVKGPYFNGVFGQPWIDKLTCGKILVIAGGLGQSPVISIIKTLINGNNKVEAVLAPGKVGKVFIDHVLNELGVDFTIVDSFRRNGSDLVKTRLLSSRYDLIVSAGPDEQHYAIIDIMHELGVNLPMAATNNATMCCGEGICGSCEKKTKQGDRIRACKVQINFSDLDNNDSE